MQLTLTINGIPAAPSGVGVLAPMGGMAPVGGFIPATGIGASFTPLMKGSVITKELSQRHTTAKLRFLAAPTFAINELDTVLVEDESFNKHFNGFVTSIQQRWVSKDLREVEVECHDHTWLLGTASLTASYTAQSDRFILKDIITQCGLASDISAVDGNIEVIEASLTLDITNMSARDAIESIAALTGGEWCVNQSAELCYNTQTTAAAAAYNCSDVPNGTTTFAFNKLSYQRRFPQPINQVHVLGGWDNAGSRIDVTRNDTASQTTYSRTFRKEHVDLSINTTALATFLGDAMLSSNANPEVSASFETYKDGLEVNTLIELTDAQFVLSAESLIVRRIQLEQTGESTTRYQVECGAYIPRNDRLLRLLEKQSKTRGDTPHAIPPTASITGTQISNASITGSKLVSATITGANIANATITSAKIASLDAGKITAGTISATVSMTSPTITSTSGSNVAELKDGYFKSSFGSTYTQIINGNITTDGGGDFTHLTPGTVSVLNSSAFNLVQMAIQSSAGILRVNNSSGIVKCYIEGTGGDIVSQGNIQGVNINGTGVIQVDGVEVINSAGAFVGNGVDVGTDGISAGNYAVNGGYYGDTGSFTTVDGKTVSVREGIIWDIT